MTSTNFERSLDAVLVHEGGYVNHPRDPGGATNLGVTIGTARRLGIDVDGDGDTDIVDIKKLTKKDAAKVYRHEYWNKVRGDDLPSGVDYAVFDFAVHSGPGRAIPFLQRVLGVEDDGALGPVTMRAIMNANAAMVAATLCERRLAWLKGLPTWSTFGKGWARRVNGVKTLAVQMAREAPQPVPAVRPDDGLNAPEPPVQAPQPPSGEVWDDPGETDPTMLPPPEATPEGPGKGIGLGFIIVLVAIAGAGLIYLVSKLGA